MQAHDSDIYFDDIKMQMVRVRVRVRVSHADGAQGAWLGVG